MESVLIIVTSSNKKNGFCVRTYNEQEIGLARALSKKGYRCSIAYYGGNIEKKEIITLDGYDICMYLFKGHDLLKNAFFNNYDCIYNQYDILLPITYDHYETYHIAMRFPQKTIVYHGTYFAPFNKAYNYKCRIVDKIFIKGYKKNNTHFVTKNRLAADFLISKGINNVKVIGVGFDAEQMNCETMLASDLTEKLNTYKKEGYKLLLYVGRIEERRNIMFLLDVFCRINKCEKVKLVIIGTGNEKYKKKCERFIASHNISDDVEYVERMEQQYLPQIYKQADLFLLPTSYEIFGMVILEAMYFGVPVLTTLNGGSDILIQDGITGFIIPELNIDKWTKKSVEILNRDNSSLADLAHETIVNNFVWDVLVEKFIESFESIK